MEHIREEVENVLVLAMSTFPNAEKATEYKYIFEDGEALSIQGISQLEAGTKVVMRLLEKRGERLHRIVVLNTNATETKYVKKTNEESIFQGYTPYEFYVARILQYAPSFPRACFVPVNIEEKGNRYLVDVSQVIKGDGKAQIRLYMDMQGGDRNMVFSMNAVAELLKNQGVEICARLATSYDKNNAINTINEVSERYRTYELLTAMEVFIKYGWGNELKQYFERYANDFDGKVVAAIQRASIAIQTCNVKGFDEAVMNLGALIADYKAKREELKHSPYMDIIIEEISKDYGELLDKNLKLRYVQQIRWCLRKGFLQQAISILESKMPHEYVTSGVKYYCRRGVDNPEDTMEMFRRIHSVMSEKRDREIYKLADINHFYIRYFRGIVKALHRDLSGIDGELWYSDYVDDPKEDNKTALERESEINANLEVYKKLCGNRNLIAHAVSQVDEQKEHSFYHEIYVRGKHPEMTPDTQLVQTIEQYLDDFCRIAEGVSEVQSIDLE